ncbi:hypothetical protein AwDysgo_01010 [Bacteroidales bacterium]|nr:hypothetical protein AwDysgo_01010 [Bacteroidales bacterium]
MDKKEFALGKTNFVLIAIAMIVITIGFALMTGGKTTEETGFDPSIFGKRQIVVAPIVTMAGFIMVIWGILKKDKQRNK